MRDMNKEQNQSKEFDIVGLIKKIFADFKTLVAILTIFAVIGVVVALNTPRTYTTNVILAPEFGSTSELSDNLGDLASMVGIDLSSKGGNIDAIYPQIYPDVFASTDFILSLFNTPVSTLNATDSKKYFEHLTQDVKIPFWKYPSIWLKQKFSKEPAEPANHQLDPFNLTKGENDIVNVIRGNISCNVDKKTSVITISVKDFDQKVSAVMADTLCHKLQDYITLYRTKKARNSLAQTEKLYRESKARYEKIRDEYNKFSDANTDLTLPSLKSKQEDMENEMQLRYNSFTQLSQQVQAARAKLQEKTPVFSIIQNASIPVKPSGTPRMYIVLAYIFVGFVIDSIWVLMLKDFFVKRKAKENSKEEETK